MAAPLLATSVCGLRSHSPLVVVAGAPTVGAGPLSRRAGRGSNLKPGFWTRPQPCKVCFGRERRRRCIGKKFVVVGVRAGLLPVDPWAPNTDTQSIASSLFAASLFPYLGFLYHITKSKSSPKLTLFGFYFLLAFVGATIPAGIYAKVHYGTSLSNVDWLHGGAESLLTLTNLFIVFGLRNALQKPPEPADDVVMQEEEKNVPLPK